MEDSYEDKLLFGWEEVFKKSQLTLLILLALKDGPKYMAEVKEFMVGVTNELFQVDDKSVYRALRRYTDSGMVDYSTEPNHAGPDRKLYALTVTGQEVLSKFVLRNITGVFFTPRMKDLLL